MDADKVGAIPLFTGTLMITCIAMLVAVPIGLVRGDLSQRFRLDTRPRRGQADAGNSRGYPNRGLRLFRRDHRGTVYPRHWRSAWAFRRVRKRAGGRRGHGDHDHPVHLVAFRRRHQRGAAILARRLDGVGATKAETIRQVVLPAALPGIVSAVLLGVSRAVGETMIVVMAAGQGANLTANPLEAVTTVTVQIVMLITGDTEASTAAGPLSRLASRFSA